MPVNPMSSRDRAGSPRRRRAAELGDRRVRRRPRPPRSTAVDRERQVDLGMLGAESIGEPVERLEHLLGLRLARDDPAVDLDDAAVGHHVGSAPALDDRRVHGRSPDERMLEVGQDLLDPEEEPRHRGDRAHAEVRRGAVRRLAASGGGDPRAPPFGQGEVQVRRLADDGRVLVEVARVRTGPWSRAGRRAPRRPRGGDRAGQRARRPSDGSPRPRQARSRCRLSCPPPPARSARRRRPRRRTVDAATPRGLRRGRRRGGRSTRAPAGRRCRTARRRSGVPRRRVRSRASRRDLGGSPSRRRPRRPRCRRGSRSAS